MSNWSLEGEIPQNVSIFFEAIESENYAKVRQLIAADKSLTSVKCKSEKWKWESDMALDAYKFLGAYIGSMTGLQLAILKGFDGIGKDLADATLETEDFNIPFGGGNTALHLATFLGAKDMVKLLLKRGIDVTIKNSKGFRAIDVVDDEEMRAIFTQQG